MNQAPLGAFKRQSSLRPSDLPSIQEARYRGLPSNTSKQIFLKVKKKTFFLFFSFRRS